jgi:hypothetical protein
LLRHPSAQGLRPADWVHIIELPLPAPSLSPARRPPPHVVAKPCLPMRPLPHCFFFIQHNHVVKRWCMVGALYLVRPYWQYQRVLWSDTLLGLANPVVPWRLGGLTASTSASTLLFPPHLPWLRHRLSLRPRRPWLHRLQHCPLPRRLPWCVSVITLVPLLRLQLHQHGNPITTTLTSAIFNTASSNTGNCTLKLGYLDIGKGLSSAWVLVGFLSSHSICTAPTCDCEWMSVDFFSRLQSHHHAHASTAGEW